MVAAQYYGWIAVVTFISAGLFLFIVPNRIRWRLNRRPGLLSILFIALVLRIAAFALFGIRQFGDFSVYEQMAWEIRNGAFWISLEKQTGPSLMYALASFPFGSVLQGGLVLNLLLQVWDVYLAYCIGRDLRSEKAGIYAAVFVAFFPDHIYFTRLLSSEVFFSTGMLLATWLLIRSRQKPALFLPLGILVGAMNYFRPQAILLLAAMMLVVVLSNRSAKAKYWSGMAVGGFILAGLPLFIYNYQQLSKVSVVPAQVSGLTMLFATTNSHDGIFQLDQYDLFQELQTAGEGEHPLVVANRKAKSIALHRIAHNPGKWLRYTFTNRLPLQFGGSSIRWAWESAPQPIAGFHLIAAYICGIIFLLYAVYLASGRYVPDDLNSLMLIMLGFTVALHLFSEVNPRYNHHLVLLAGVVLSTEWRYRDNWIRRKAHHKIKDFTL